MVLSGNGGIGKTQIAINYISSHENQYAHIAFISASSGEVITRDYSKYLGISNDENTVTSMRHWASSNTRMVVCV